MSAVARPRLAARKNLRETFVLPSRVLVTIKRDMAEVISQIVFEHEVDVLSEVHGEGNVHVVEEPLKHNILIGDQETLEKGRAAMRKAAAEKQRVAAFIFVDKHPLRKVGPDKHVVEPVRVGDEMERLRAAYGMHPTQQAFAVDVAYPSERDFIEAAGGPWEERARAS